jgi:hypothetical protein
MGIDHNYNEDFAIARGGNFATGTVWSINVSDRVHIDGSHSYQPNVVSGGYTGYPVIGESLVIVDTSSINSTINNLAYGVDGQVITFVKPYTNNTLILRHLNTSSGGQPICTISGNDITITGHGAVEMVCYNDYWYVKGNF